MGAQGERAFRRPSPDDLIETDSGAVEVFEYIEAYIRDQLDKAGDQDDLSSKS